MPNTVLVTTKLDGIIRQSPELSEIFASKLALDSEGNVKQRAPILTGNLKNSIKARKIRKGLWVLEDNTSYGQFPEFGTVHMSPRPFFRPGVIETLNSAPRSMQEELQALINNA
jgi:HK97 gp10 family phage protein